MKYLAFIAARGGSKGIKNKNIVNLNDKPLIEYTFDAAKRSANISEVHLSTDDDKIAEVAKKNNVQVLYRRPDLLANDTASVVDVVLYHLDWLKKNQDNIPENVILLQPTSPVRGNTLIDDCIVEFENSNRDSLLAVSECVQHPYETFTPEGDKIRFLNTNLTRRQEYPPFYFITGSVYIFKSLFVQKFKKLFDENTAYYVTSQAEAVDIDSISDLELAEFYLKSRSNNRS
jgi:CMP-N,N'-diacetyllegionaminic acid synthase